MMIIICTIANKINTNVVNYTVKVDVCAENGMFMLLILHNTLHKHWQLIIAVDNLANL